MTLDPVTARRLVDLALPDGPLFVIDVDDVVLHFLGPFRRLLGEEGLELRLASFRLHGNVVDARGEPVEGVRVSALIDRIFTEQAERQSLVDGAAEGLATLARHGVVLLLTAMRHAHFDVREGHLRGLGIDAPLVTTEGSKGKAIAALARAHPTAFVDDMPYNHADVLAHVPDARSIHFMADRSLDPLLPRLPEATVPARSWDEVVDAALRGVAEAARSG